MASGKKNSISLKDKLQIISRIEKGEKQTEVCQTLGLPKTTVNMIWKKRDTFKRQFESSEVCGDVKRSMTSNHKDVDTALLEWFKQARHNNIPINGPLLLAKANTLASVLGDTAFKATNGFIDRWKTRHGIVFKKVCGEEESVSQGDTETWLDVILPEHLDQFAPENIFNADETGLFYKLQPDRTMTFKGERCSGGKKAKDCLTLLVGASVMGEKLPLVVIGKSKSPRCFKGIRSLPLDYMANAKAWMTGDLFEDIVKKWNAKFSREGRHILLILDNCPAHPRHLSFSNITMKFLPPNTTSKLQPCDQGIIQSMKVHYRYHLVQKQLLAIEDGEEMKISVLDAMQWLKIAWEEVTSTTIRNCFHHAGFKNISVPMYDHENSEPDIARVIDDLRANGVSIEGQIDEFTAIDDDLETAGTLTDGDIVATICGTMDQEEDNTDVDEQDVPVICPTTSEFRHAMDIARRFVTCTSDNQEDIRAVHSLEKLLFTTRRRQTTLYDFFRAS